MTLQEIAIFKHFIGRHELRKNFIAKYRKSIGMTRNPESIEKYLSNVEPEKVIQNAVKHFVANEAMGFDFWQSVNDSWRQYLKKMRASHTIEQENPINLRGYFSALRENWDKDKPWVYDPISVAQLRYGLITEDEEPQVETPVGQEQVQEDDGHDDVDIDFFDIDKTSRQVNGLRQGIMSVNVRNHSYKLGVNRTDTKDIAAKHIKYVMAGTLKNGRYDSPWYSCHFHL